MNTKASLRLTIGEIKLKFRRNFNYLQILKHNHHCSCMLFSQWLVSVDSSFPKSVELEAGRFLFKENSLTNCVVFHFTSVIPLTVHKVQSKHLYCARNLKLYSSKQCIVPGLRKFTVF